MELEGSTDRCWGNEPDEVEDAARVRVRAQACAEACAQLAPKIEALVNAHLHKIQTQVQAKLGPLLDCIVQDVQRAEMDIAAAQNLVPELERLDAFLNQVTNMRSLPSKAPQQTTSRPNATSTKSISNRFAMQTIISSSDSGSCQNGLRGVQNMANKSPGSVQKKTA